MTNKLARNYIVEIKQILTQARAQAYTAVNSAMVQAYWLIGKRIIEEEQHGKKRANYGEEVLLTLSKELTKEFGKGFAISNIRDIRQFYLTFPNRHALRGDLGWTHYRFLMRIDNVGARQFYMSECVKSRWSTRQLERQINTHFYERLLSSRDKKAVSKEIMRVEQPARPKDFIRSPYVLEFLDVSPAPNLYEKDLETAIIDHLQSFLLELGRGFSFVARQKRISFDGRDFYIDLVFYHYILKCFVLVDLKMDDLTHQDLGQMQMYVNYFSRELRQEGDNPPIGLILCADKSEAVVKYTLPKDNKQIFASKYMLYLPTEKELIKEIARQKKILHL
ncbi:MAG: PDDEXK nuclease domain-containing protein [Candidatus Margulisbacteria bacterium]|jgi:predicted nuclease of restriction endonuclease-like (RecB) superfamily|nr:PDDEXK nuclease domain-containing protein [Candidatus Margulisiibacteriota bacterium]